MKVIIKREGGPNLHVDSENKDFIAMQEAAAAGNDELAHELAERLIASGAVHFISDKPTESTGIDVHPFPGE